MRVSTEEIQRVRPITCLILKQKRARSIRIKCGRLSVYVFETITATTTTTTTTTTLLPKRQFAEKESTFNWFFFVLANWTVIFTRINR